MALLEQAAGQGHAYAMDMLASIHRTRGEHEQAVVWATKGAEAGLPKAMFHIGVCLDEGQGVAAPDYPAAAEWYRRAAAAGHGYAAYNLGMAVQVDPIKPMLKAPGTQFLKLKKL